MDGEFPSRLNDFSFLWTVLYMHLVLPLSDHVHPILSYLFFVFFIL